MSKDDLIPPHGGYRNLKSFQVSQLVYDITVRFCDRYISIKSRTHDQMVQAARSGVQNIAEGSQCSGTSKKFELKLTSVARASLEELKLDYEDFLRHRNLKAWGRDNHLRQELINKRFKTVEEVSHWIRAIKSKQSATSSTKSSQSTYASLAANSALALINVACYLLDKQIDVLAKQFENEGGFTERLYRVRKKRRG
ncbi:MAG: four helix bundle suffix domain-containing protein [Lentisphaeraceae bacterium]|nr:four helix bundle suffix domain-containing protein [Lentisphaeraceae bacterium]